MNQHIPECFKDKMIVDAAIAAPVVPIGLALVQRRARRACQVYFSGPAGGGTINGGTPVALTG